MALDPDKFCLLSLVDRQGWRCPTCDAFYLHDAGVAPIGICDNCQARITDLPATNAPATGDPAIVECRVCRQLTMRVLDAREPKHFFTD